MTPRWYEMNPTNVRPSITGSHIPYFHSMMCEWAYGIALSFFWVVIIEAQQKNHLMNSILDVANIEPGYRGKWKVSDRETNKLFNNQTQETIGCIFAQSVRLPGESTAVESFGGGRGGHLKSSGVVSRGDLPPLEIGFRETNLSFTDFLLRPWNIVTSYKGLISDDGSLSGPASYWGGSIKSNIHVYQLAKGGANKEGVESLVRKEMHFFDAVPITISDDDLNHEAGGVNKRQVTFAYNYYSVGPGNAQHARMSGNNG